MSQLQNEGERADSKSNPPREQHPKDPRFLLAYGIGDLEKVLPWERKTIKELEATGLFPSGVSLREGMQKVWPRKVLEAYLDLVSAEAMQQLPQIAATIKAITKPR